VLGIARGAEIGGTCRSVSEVERARGRRCRQARQGMPATALR